jgi:protein gp37
MQKTKIDWADYTFNPVTGCYHKCPYCYARKMADRFKPKDCESWASLANMQQNEFPIVEAEKMCPPFPQGFIPTLYYGRLNEPQHIKKSQNIFVCSMADLFGEWVPDEWIKQVFEACKKAPQHRYLFLTKNPKRYVQFDEYNEEPIKNQNMFFGATATNEKQLKTAVYYKVDFISFEPLMEWIGVDEWLTSGNLTPMIKWAIIGGETGNRNGKVVTKKRWVKDIVDVCKRLSIPVFLKDSLATIWGEPLIQEYPWGTVQTVG